MSNANQDDRDVRPGRFHEEHYQPFRKSSPAMESAAMVLAVLSLVFSWVIYLSVPMGATAIILALLSRGSGRIVRRVKTSIIMACAGIIVSTAVTGFSVYRIYTTPELRARMEQLIEYYSGYSSDPLTDLTENETSTAADEPEQPVSQDTLLEDLLSGGKTSGGDFL